MGTLANESLVPEERKAVKPWRRERFGWCLLVFMVCGAMATAGAYAQESRYVVIDQDAVGPAGTDMNSILIFLQNKNVNVLGITVVTGDGWRDEEVAHTLRLLELVGRTDIPVAAGAIFPLVRTQQWTHHWEQIYGRLSTRAPGAASAHNTARMKFQNCPKDRQPSRQSTRMPPISLSAWCISIRTG
jgi:inosine-uridine preferring nucleoside hydrolase